MVLLGRMGEELQISLKNPGTHKLSHSSWGKHVIATLAFALYVWEKRGAIDIFRRPDGVVVSTRQGDWKKRASFGRLPFEP